MGAKIARDLGQEHAANLAGHLWSVAGRPVHVVAAGLRDGLNQQDSPPT